MMVTLDRPLLPSAPPPQAFGGSILLAPVKQVGLKDCRGTSASWESPVLAGAFPPAGVSGKKVSAVAGIWPCWPNAALH